MDGNGHTFNPKSEPDADSRHLLSAGFFYQLNRIEI